MLAGSFLQTIIRQTRTTSKGALGTTETWTDAASYFAKVAPVSLDAQARYQQILNGRVTHIITVRGDIEFTLSDRFLWGTQYLKPISPPQKSAPGLTPQVWTTLYCQEIEAA